MKNIFHLYWFLQFVVAKIRNVKMQEVEAGMSHSLTDLPFNDEEPTAFLLHFIFLLKILASTEKSSMLSKISIYG